jgi:chorismate synthase
VAAGAIARKVIAREGIEVLGYTVELGGVTIGEGSRRDIRKNNLLCPDAKAARK